MANEELLSLETAWSQMDTEFQYWEAHWRDLGRYFLPRRPRWLTSDHNEGKKLHNNIINGTALDAVETLSSGMMAGITSPARPWFRLTISDQELAEFKPVKEWLSLTELRMRNRMLRSNVYRVFPMMYEDMAVFGVASSGLFTDFETTIRAHSFPIGQYRISLNQRMRPDIFMRRFVMTTRQLVEEFGMDNVPPKIQSQYKNKHLEERHDVKHAVIPNRHFKTDAMGAAGMRFADRYYLDGAHEETFLRQGGYRENPIVTPRWKSDGEDVYGKSPGMKALGDQKSLQLHEKDFLKAVEKKIDPPMTAPPYMKNEPKSIMAGKVTYVDRTKNQGGFEAAHTVDLDLGAVLTSEERIEARIERFFHQDLFLMLARGDNPQMTATEIAARREEKLLVLGPVLESVNDEMLDPTVERYYNEMDRRGEIPPAPEELQGVALNVEYISIMAQAQKLVGITAVDRFVAHIATTSALDPTVVDKFDADQSADRYADMLALDPGIVRDDEEVAEIREARAIEAARQEQLAVAREAVSAAKEMSETDVTQPNALTEAVLGGPVPGQTGGAV